jgi:hypothetical protein
VTFVSDPEMLASRSSAVPSSGAPHASSVRTVGVAGRVDALRIDLPAGRDLRNEPGQVGDVIDSRVIDVAARVRGVPEAGPAFVRRAVRGHVKEAARLAATFEPLGGGPLESLTVLGSRLPSVGPWPGLGGQGVPEVADIGREP